MNRQEKLASWQQLKSDAKRVVLLPDPKAVKLTISPVTVKSEEILSEEPNVADTAVQEPVLQKFGKKKKVEDTE